LGSRFGALQPQYKVIKSPGINTVDSKCLTPVDVAHYAFMSCSTLRLIVLSQGYNPCFNLYVFSFRAYRLFYSPSIFPSSW